MNKVTIIGSGRSGRGMLGELFFSAGNWDIVFADNDPALVDGLKKQGWYGVEQKGLIDGKLQYTKVENFTVLDTVADHAAYIAAMAESDVVATALFPEAFDQVAKDMAESIRLRAANGSTQPAAYLLGANFVHLLAYYAPRIAAELDASEKAYMDRYISLVISMVNRKNVFPDAFVDDKYAITGDNKPVLKVDNALKPNFTKVPDFFRRTDNLDAGMCEKIWTGNLDHCSFAFMGVFKGYATVNEAVCDDEIRKCVYYAWLEGRRAIEAEFGIPVPDHAFKVEAYKKYASPYFADSLYRIGRDPARKLKRYDRFLGPALLCIKHGIAPTFILRAASYGFLYRDASNPPALAMQKMIEERGIEQAMLDITLLDPSNREERFVYETLLNNFRAICTENPIEIQEIRGEST